MRKWRAKNPERSKDINKKSREKTGRSLSKSEVKLNDRLKSEYGITISDFYDMVRIQNGKCDICGRPPSEKEGRLSVDHCHKTGKVRALLCQRCNGGLGCFGDDRYNLQKAIEYLTKHQEDDWLSELG